MNVSVACVNSVNTKGKSTMENGRGKKKGQKKKTNNGNVKRNSRTRVSEFKMNGKNVFLFFSFFEKIDLHKNEHVWTLSCISTFFFSSFVSTSSSSPSKLDIFAMWKIHLYAVYAMEYNWSNDFRFVMWMTKRKPRFFFRRLNVPRKSIQFILHNLHTMQRQPLLFQSPPFLKNFITSSSKQRTMYYARNCIFHRFYKYLRTTSASHATHTHTKKKTK